MPVHHADDKAKAWNEKWKDSKATSFKFALALRDWHGYIASPILRFQINNEISRSLIALLTAKHQARLQRNNLDETNKPQFRVKLAQTVFQQKLHPAARLFSSHIDFLASYQAAFNHLRNKNSFKQQIDRELLLIHRSEANKRRRAKRAEAKRRQEHQQQGGINISGTASTSTSSTPSKGKAPSPAPTEVIVSSSPASPDSEPDIERIIEEDLLAYGNIEISPPS